MVRTWASHANWTYIDLTAILLPFWKLHKRPLGGDGVRHFEQSMENVASCVARQQKAFDEILLSNLFSHQSWQLIICCFYR